MKMNAFISFIIAMSLVITASVAGAWEIELTNSDGLLTEGETYQLDIVFNGQETDNLGIYGVNVSYSTDLLELVNIDMYDYGFTWSGGGFTMVDPEAGLIESIMGEEALGTSGVFYPVASGQTTLATLYFTALASGSFEDVAVFTSAGITIATEVNHVYRATEDLMIYEEGSSSFVAPVPIPAAVWLLGSGLVGLAGFRRKTKD